MNLFLLNQPAENQQDISIRLEQLVLHEPLQDKNERIEFPFPSHLQPVVYTEGCVAAGCPEDLW